MSVQSEIDRINGAKSTIAANIKDSGVSVQEGARLEVLAPLVGDIVGQFSDELDLIIGGDTTPVTDITARLSAVNGVSGDVSTQLDTLDGTKTAIKDAIIAKGVDVPDGTVFRDYAGKIGEIEAGGSAPESVSVVININSDQSTFFVVPLADGSGEYTKFVYVSYINNGKPQAKKYSIESTYGVKTLKLTAEKGSCIGLWLSKLAYGSSTVVSLNISSMINGDFIYAYDSGMNSIVVNGDVTINIPSSSF